MTKAIRLYENGGPEVFKYEDVEVGDPGPGQIKIKQTAIGLNFIDVYQRTGLYPAESFPDIVGMEAAGVVEAVGEGVTDKKVGDRVAYCMIKGAYTESRCVEAWKAVKLPDAVDDKTAAAMMLKGLTAHYLLHRTYPVKPGDPVLVYAAAGGVGQILCQWGKALGAVVIGCVGSAEKAEIAKAAGAAYAINYSEEDIAEKAREYTGGEGVAAAYDSVGKATFMPSLDSLRPFGVLATYGNASGPVDPFAPAILGGKGSLYVTRPTLATHTRNPEILAEGANALFDAVTSGTVKIHINQEYALADVAKAHTDLEGRKTTGSSVIIP
ncbi:MAG: quinone oxidoreductase [Rhodospirillaceae bacterium]|nr:quinone oxidoreductase [Rhodospirillaceae bacterium]